MKRKLSVLLLVVLLITSIPMFADTYVVQDGDVLWKIAEKYGMDYKTLAELRATPAVFVCDNSTTAETMYEAMLVFGFYKDFSIVVPGPKMSDCSIEIEGLA